MCKYANSAEKEDGICSQDIEDAAPLPNQSTLVRFLY